MRMRLDEQRCKQLFLDARTHRAWLPREVPDSLLREIVDLMKMGPTANNCLPARVVFVKSKAAKERLKPHLSEGNVDKTMEAPACAIIGYDLEFYAHPPKGQDTAGKGFVGKPEQALTLRDAQRLPAGRLFHHGGAGAGARLRPDVGLRQCRRRQGVLRRHGRQIEFSVQSGLRRSGGAAPARPALRLRARWRRSSRAASARMNILAFDTCLGAVSVAVRWRERARRMADARRATRRAARATPSG